MSQCYLNLANFASNNECLLLISNCIADTKFIEIDENIRFGMMIDIKFKHSKRYNLNPLVFLER